MAEVTQFATLAELIERWPDFPAGAEDHANVLLADASQFIVDTVPSALTASASTLRRIVCAVVKRAMASGDATGNESVQYGTGPFQMTAKPTNPHGDFYLTKQERRALGEGRQTAFGVQVASFCAVIHRPWCNLNFGALDCSCGADIAGVPIYE